MKAKSIKGNSAADIQAALGQSMADGFKPTLAIVFLSVKQDRAAICKLLDETGIAVYGATTNGEFTSEGISSGEIAMMLLDLNRSYFHMHFEEFSENNYRHTTREIAKNIETI